MDFGTALHQALESWKRPIKKNRKIVTPQHALIIFKKMFVYLYAKHEQKYSARRPVDVQLRDNMLASGEQILKHFDECVEVSSAQVVFNEYRLQEKIDRSDDVNIQFKGYIDFVIKTKAKNGDTVLYVCDFKTCSWGWDGDKRKDRWTQFQILLYKHFLCKKLDLDPKYVRTAFILLKKRPPRGTAPVEFFSISAGPVAVQRALDNMNSVITEMDECKKTGVFQKNRKCCTNDFGEVCPYLHTPECPDDELGSKNV